MFVVALKNLSVKKKRATPLHGAARWKYLFYKGLVT